MGKAKTTGEYIFDDNETEEDLLLDLSDEELDIEYARTSTDISKKETDRY